MLSEFQWEKVGDAETPVGLAYFVIGKVLGELSRSVVGVAVCAV
ncbi:MAG: hypothetical protein R3C01_05335 [Planctomycetaceae bacterium]